MALHMIGYDLNKPGQDYDDLFEAIKGISSTWWHCLDSTWLVVTDLTCKQIRDKLAPHMDSSDELLVAKLTGDMAWRGFNQNCEEWLQTNYNK